ncbi:unnamed protein product, partial [Wuchereria bancrofti]
MSVECLRLLWYLAGILPHWDLNASNLISLGLPGGTVCFNCLLLLHFNLTFLLTRRDTGQMSSDGNRSESAPIRSASRSRSGTPMASGKSNGHARSPSGSRPRSSSHHSLSQSPVRERSAASRSSGGHEASRSPSRARSRSRDDRRVRRSRSPEERKRYRSRSRDSRYRRRRYCLS